MSDNHVTGKTIMITGAGGGFGRLVAERVGALGANVVATDINEANVRETAELVKQAGGNAIARVADVATLDDLRQAAAAAVETYNAIDIMINNAGIMPLAMYSDHAIAAEAWDRCIDINFKGVVHGISAVHDQMIGQGRGHVVNVASIYGNYPVTGAAVYGATKAAVGFLSEALRQESLGKIKVTTIRPTGVPGTNLGDGVVNSEAIGGILGVNGATFMNDFGAVLSENPPQHLVDEDSIGYFALSPELLADNIVYAINQPWGVSISDLTVRASGDRYVV